MITTVDRCKGITSFLITFVATFTVVEGRDCYVSGIIRPPSSGLGSRQQVRQPLLTSPDDAVRSRDECTRLWFGGFNSYASGLILHNVSENPRQSEDQHSEEQTSTQSAVVTTPTPTTASDTASTSPSTTNDQSTPTEASPTATSTQSTTSESTSSQSTTSPMTTTISTTDRTTCMTSETIAPATTTDTPTTARPTSIPTDDQFEDASDSCLQHGAETFASCHTAYNAGYFTDGVYLLTLSTDMTYRAYCDMTNGGWMVMQRRLNGFQPFDLIRAKYNAGFGNLYEEFYWGNENLQALQDSTTWELNVTITTFTNVTSSILYPQFLVETKANYNLHVPDASNGTAGDGLHAIDGAKFCTSDEDHDGNDINIALDYHTGWWLNDNLPPLSNLNGKYYSPGETREAGHGIIWVNDESLKATQMKIRPPLADTNG